jgi:GT2 family glycosyltransferase
VQRLAEALEDPGLAAVGPVLLRASDGRVESRGLAFAPRLGRVRLLGSGESFVAREGRVDVAALSGAVLMLSAAALDRVGLLDEGYFHSFEDLDWCVRAREAGLRLEVVLGARARHEGSATLGPSSSDRFYYASRSQLRAAARLWPLAGAAAALRTASILARNLAHAVVQRDAGRPGAVRAVLEGARDFRRGRGGPRGGAA